MTLLSLHSSKINISVKKIRVSFIFTLVAIAMIALIIIQIFQASQLYDKKSIQFNERFSTIIDRIAFRHEKAVDLRDYLQLANKDLDLRYKDILKEEFKTLLSAKESISIEDTAIYEDGEMKNYLIIKGKSYDSISGLTAEQRVLARDVRQLRDLYNRNPNGQINKDSLQLAVQLDQRVVQQIFKKARFVNEMMLNAFKNNVYEKPSDRLDITFLDSVIKNEFSSEKLPMEFEYVITDEYNVPINFDQSPNNYNNTLDTANCHITQLYPSNALDEDLYLHINFINEHSFLLSEMWVGLSINIVLVFLITLTLIFMFKTILTQKKLSELKNDFISNMTHEFKTPISTISLACEAMNDEDMNGKLSEEKAPFVSMIQEENKRLGVLVDRILQSAVLDRGELKIRKETVLLNEVLSDIVQKSKLRIDSLNGKITLNIPSELIKINADNFHFINVISNLIDNAIKYSNQSPDITVTLMKVSGKLILSVTDNGIGIKKEHLHKIFDKLYRIPTGNIHNVKGFGLGLSYVKAIIALHEWEINVESKIDHGSIFTIEIKQ